MLKSKPEIPYVRRVSFSFHRSEPSQFIPNFSNPNTTNFHGDLSKAAPNQAISAISLSLVLQLLFLVSISASIFSFWHVLTSLFQFWPNLFLLQFQLSKSSVIHCSCFLHLINRWILWIFSKCWSILIVFVFLGELLGKHGEHVF